MNILITGGTGLIGAHLTSLLLEKGYSISYLTRSSSVIPNVKTHQWNVENMTIDDEAIKNADHIVHLAGAGIADLRWNEKRKQELYDSRINSSNLLYKSLKEIPNNVMSVTSASAVGYYGDTDDNLVSEDASPSDDYLGNMCKDWESAVNQMQELDKRIVVLRFASMVLTDRGGGLPKIAAPIKWFVGAPISDGNSYMSWVYIEDLSNFIIKSIEDQSINGTYNVVAPQQVTNMEMTKAIARVLHRPILLPGVPVFILKIIFGELGGYLNHSSRVSSQKIIETGFSFKFPQLLDALHNIYDN
ncbi:TIGR01777 family oxidoreductase [Sphingobacteriaceae bacterium AH-315-L07]|nr:TIGR01777 family oxidoreductase [Sphingobacteriaceae bacterium AH-315-L07]